MHISTRWLNKWLFTILCIYSSVTYAVSPPTLWSDIPYGTLSSQKINFYQPSGNLPIKGLVIWIHGGGWSGGDKLDPDLNFYIPAFNKGLAVISINYRLVPEGAFPNDVLDVLAVLAAVEKGGCPNCAYPQNPVVWKTIQTFSKRGIMISGGSAGGYLATYAGGSYITNTAITNVKCINNNVGPVDLRPLNLYSPLFVNPYIFNFAGGDLSVAKLSNMSPTYHAEVGYLKTSGKKVKWILNYNMGDNLIPINTTYKFTTLLQESGAQVYSNVVNEPGPAGMHNISDSTKTFWITQATSICFGI